MKGLEGLEPSGEKLKLAIDEGPTSSIEPGAAEKLHSFLDEFTSERDEAASARVAYNTEGAPASEAVRAEDAYLDKVRDAANRMNKEDLGALMQHLRQAIKQNLEARDFSDVSIESERRDIETSAYTTIESVWNKRARAN